MHFKTWVFIGAALLSQAAFGQGAMTNGQNHTGSISAAGQLQTWTFSATSGDAISVRVGKLSGSVFVPYVRIYRPDNTLASGDWGSSVTDVTFNANQTGTYTVTVASNDTNNVGTGTYRITLAKTTGAFVVPGGDEGGTLTNGENHTGTIHLGDIDMWSFPAVAGDAISVRVGELTDNDVFTPYLRIYRPDGSLVSGDWSTTVTDVTVNANQTGTYLVLVTTNDTYEVGTGNYRITLAKSTGAFVVPSGDEGGTMTNGQNHTGTIHLGDIDMWSFPAVAGDAISVRIGETSDNNVFTPYLRIYRPDGSLVSGDWSTQVTDVTVNANQTGTYTVFVTTNDTYEVGTGNYRITLAKSTGSFVVPNNDEGGAMTNGQNHTGTIHLGDLDMWSFSASAGDAISVRIGELTDLGVFTPYLRIYRPDGSLASGDWSTQVTDVTINAGQTGTYLVVVASNDTYEIGTGPYRITLAKSTGTFVVPSGDDGGAMTNGQNHTGTIHLGDLDMWTFQASAGESMSVRIGELTDNDVFTPYLRIYRPDGSLASGDWSTQVTDVSISASQTGTYLVVVATNDTYEIGTGTYRITLAKSPGAYVVPPSDEGGPLAVGGGNTGTIHMGDIDMWSLNATAGERINLTVAETSDTGVFTPYIRIYRPDGTQQSGDWGSVSASLSLNAPVTGTYTVLIASNDTYEIGTGAYRITSSHAGTPGGQPPPPPPTTSTGPFHYNPITPCRVIDTRATIGTFGGPYMPGQSIRDIPVPSSPCGVPGTAAAYALNITVVPRGPLGYLSIWPTGTAQPMVSTLNALDGRIKANAAIVPAGSGGSVSVFVTNDTDVIIDINGYFSEPNPTVTLQFYPVAPCRIIDTRNAQGPLGGPQLSAQVSRTVPVLSSSCGIPSTARAYSLNATVVPDGPFGYLTMWPTGSSQPIASTLNAVTGAITANAAIIPAGTAGSIDVFGNSATHLIVDINGYFGPPGATGALSFHTLQPCRISDTRTTPNSAFAGPAQTGGVAREYPLASSSCTGNSGAAAYSVNATVVPSGPMGYLTLWPGSQAIPLVSTLNAVDGAITSNAAIVVGGGSGQAIQAFTSSTTHLLLDINGVFR